MPRPSFRGDPYAALGVASNASAATIKARWRRLAREHHPDLVGGDADASVQATPRWAARGTAAGPPARTPEGPPRPRPSRPVTGRVDASSILRPRNTVTTPPGLRTTLPGHPPRPRGRTPQEPLRASQPCGPVIRRRAARPAPRPSLDEAMTVPLEFGRFRGHTLGEVAGFEPTYIDWIASTVSRDRDLVVAARVIRDELDRLGIVRLRRTPHPGFGVRREGVA